LGGGKRRSGVFGEFADPTEREKPQEEENKMTGPQLGQLEKKGKKKETLGGRTEGK